MSKQVEHNQIIIGTLEYERQGGKINHIPSGAASTARKAKQTKPPPKLPSAKNCRSCEQYNRGLGATKCLQCRNYKLLEREDSRSTISIIPMVQSLIDAIPAPARPNNPIQSMVWSLPAQEAAMIGVAYYSNLSPREIAQVMRITEAAARAKLYRAVEQLKKNLSELYPGVTTKLEAKLQLLL